MAGFFMTCTVSPFDRIRTNLMNQPADKQIYTGFVDCVRKTVAQDGVSSLWRGFIPMYVKILVCAVFCEKERVSEGRNVCARVD
jgi:hypothetical protein